MAGTTETNIWEIESWSDLWDALGAALTGLFLAVLFAVVLLLVVLGVFVVCAVAVGLLRDTRDPIGRAKDEVAAAERRIDEQQKAIENLNDGIRNCDRRRDRLWDLRTQARGLGAGELHPDYGVPREGLLLRVEQEELELPRLRAEVVRRRNTLAALIAVGQGRIIRAKAAITREMRLGDEGKPPTRAFADRVRGILDGTIQEDER
jgi:hypothetical protein